MSSILTNTSAMTALQTLKSINSNLETTQREISTGKSVGSAKDNAALWSISKVMEADVSGFKAIQDSLNLGEATLNVARNAAESTGDLLNQIKEKVVTAQESNVDRTKLQADIEQLRDQISSVVGAAQFNGLNLLQNTGTEAGSGTNTILSSLDRAADQTVADSSIAVAKQDLQQTAQSAGTVNSDVGSTATIGANTTGTAATLTGTPAAGQTYQFTAGTTAGDLNELLSSDVAYVARDGDTLSDVTNALVDRLNEQAAADELDVTFATTTTDGVIQVTNDTSNDFDVAAATIQEDDGSALDGTIGGGLEQLASMDVTTDEGAATALDNIEGLIQTTIDASAELGSAAARVEVQSEFVGNLTDSFKAGIGSLVDANMEEASARLQALQTQQQLGIQALSIANSAPQNILSLFR